MPYEKYHVKGGIINFCLPVGSEMSGCIKAGKGFEVQSLCKFSEECTGGDKCMHEKFGEYCGSHIAQKHSRGEPFSMDSIKRIKNHTDAFEDHTISLLHFGLNSHEQFNRRWDNEADHAPAVKRYKDFIEGAVKEAEKEGLPVVTAKQNPCAEVPLDGSLNVGVTYRDEEGNIKTFHPDRKKLFFNPEIDKAIQHECPVCKSLKDPEPMVANIIKNRTPDHDHEYYKCQGIKPSPSERRIHIHTHTISAIKETEPYLHTRARISNGVLKERMELGLIIYVPSADVLYDTEYHVYYTTKGILKYNKSRKHLLEHFDNWKASVPEWIPPISWANVIYEFINGTSLPEKAFSKKEVCHDCALGYKFCKNKCKNYLLS